MNDSENLNPRPTFPRQLYFLVGALLLTALVHFPGLDNGFVNWDDEAYVTRNALIRDLSGEGIEKMFRTRQVNSLYHPLTLLSYALDYKQGKNQASVYHRTNLLLHLANVALVFLLAWRMSGRELMSGLTALWFGIHPMHLESVGWVSGRKDLLYVLFFLAGLLVWWDYLRRTDGKRWLSYGLALLLFAASLLSKGMAVVFPVVLLGLDLLRRRKPNAGLFLEKLPFFALALGFGLLAVLGQQETGSLEGSPAGISILTGSRATVLYLLKSLVPFRLSPFHPYAIGAAQSGLNWFAVAGLPLIALLLWRFRSNRIVLFGLGFFLVCILPVAQFIPFGKTWFSERYTYLAYFGLFFLLAWLVDRGRELLPTQYRFLRPAILVLAGAWSLWLGVLTFQKADVWENGEELWSAVIETYPDHFYGWYSRGTWRLDHRNLQAAATDFDEAIRLNPEFPQVWFERGRLAEKSGQPKQAMADYSRAVSLDSSHAQALLNRGRLRSGQQDLPGARSDLDAAIRAKPDYGLAYLNRGALREMGQDLPGALADYGEAIRLEPGNPVFYRYRGLARINSGDLAGGMEDYNQALQLDPTFGNVYYLRSKVHFFQGNLQEARKDANQAKANGYALPPDFEQALGR